MSFTTNFVVNYEGRSELVKIPPGIPFEAFSKLVRGLYNFGEAAELFIYAVPNDFSYPIRLSSEIYESLKNTTEAIGVNNVIHLRVLTPMSFIFEVNPSHFGAGRMEQPAIEQRTQQKSIERPQFKQIKNEVEGFYWEPKEESEAGEGPIFDVGDFMKRHNKVKSQGVAASISMHPTAPTFELKDNKGQQNFAGRIQIKNTGSKKLIAMNWSLRQVLTNSSNLRVYTLPDLEVDQTYDLIFNLNIKEKTREVTYWNLCILDNEGEEAYFADTLKAELQEGHPVLSVIAVDKLAEYVSGLDVKSN